MNEVLYGRHAVEESLLAGRRKIFNIYIAEKTRLPYQARLEKLAREKKIPLKLIPRNQLDRMVAHVNHQGIVAEASSYPYCEIEELLPGERTSDKPILLFLDCLQDPQNLAALMRSAEAVGVAGVVLPRNRSASITPAVVNASAGAVEYLKVALVVNLVRTMEQLKRKGSGLWGWKMSLAPNGTIKPISTSHWDWLSEVKARAWAVWLSKLATIWSKFQWKEIFLRSTQA